MYGTRTSGKTERVQLTPQPGDSGRQKLLAFSRQSRFTGNIQYTIMSRSADKSRTRTIRCPQHISPVKRARGESFPCTLIEPASSSSLRTARTHYFPLSRTDALRSSREKAGEKYYPAGKQSKNCPEQNSSPPPSGSRYTVKNSCPSPTVPLCNRAHAPAMEDARIKICRTIMSGLAKKWAAKPKEERNMLEQQAFKE